jgi:radical SAM protein with 4Fe4S-binding SPASM domain
VKNTKNRINSLLFTLGVNILAIDHYKHNPFSHKILDKLKSTAKPEDLKFHFYPTEKNYSPHNRYGIHERHIIFVEDISVATKGTHATLNNHCGCAFPPLRRPLNKRCAKPFREVSIRWDGNIAICCNDWVGWYKCGNVLEESLTKIWNNKYFNACRKILYNSHRDFTPCKWCDALSYRVGFLPDKMGKESMPKPSKATYSIARQATAGVPLAKPVKVKYDSPLTKALKIFLDE